MSRGHRRPGSAKRRELREKVWSKFNGKCAWCGTKCNRKHNHAAQGTLDHIRPLAKGGSNRLKNLQLLCATCNGVKGDWTPQRESAHERITVQQVERMHDFKRSPK